MILFYIFIWLLAVGVLSYFKLPSIYWSVVFVFLLLFQITYANLGFVENTIFTIAVITWIISSLPFLRRNLIIKPLMINAKQNMPRYSATENDTLQAGDIGVIEELMNGKIQWEELLEVKKPKLTDEEGKFINNSVKELLAMVDDWDIVYNQANLSQEIWDYIKEERFLGLTIPREYGGHGFSKWALGQVLTRLYAKSAALGTTIAVPNAIGLSELILNYGTDEQKDTYLPSIAKGDDIPCYALTSTKAGSDATSIDDYGVICKGSFKGKEVIGIKLNWKKRYITLAPIATLIGLIVKLYDPDKLIGNQEELGITSVIVPTNLKGVFLGKRHIPLNIPFQNGPLKGSDVFVPIDFVIGGKKMIGKGWLMWMELLATGRANTVPSYAIGSSHVALSVASAYAKLRKQFNKPIGLFAGIKEPLARIIARTYMIDSAYNFTFGFIDKGVKPSIGSAIIKYHSTEMARKNINDAMDILAGKAICYGPNNYLANLYFSTPIALSFEETNIFLRSSFIFYHALLKGHPYLQKEFEAINKSDLVGLDHLLRSHTKLFSLNLIKNIRYNFFGKYLIRTPHSRIYKKYQSIKRYSANLALVSDFMISRYKVNLKTEEANMGRMADILSYLYIATAVVKRYKDNYENDTDLSVVKWSLDYLFYLIEVSFMEIIQNIPTRFSRIFLKFILFPYGRRSYCPTDKATTEISKLFMRRCEVRDKLTKYVTMDPEDKNPIGKLNKLYQQVEDLKDLLARIEEDQIFGKLVVTHGENVYEKALDVGVITEEEYDDLKKLEKGYQEVLAVDEFETEEMVRD